MTQTRPLTNAELLALQFMHMVREGELSRLKKDRRWSQLFWASSPPSGGQISRLEGFEKIHILYVAMAEKSL